MTGAAPCILIIDEDEAFSAAVAAAAQAAGFRAVCCASWWQAKPVIEGSDDIAAMIVELVLPKGTPNGLSVLLMARTRRGEVPAVLISHEPELLRQVPAGTASTLSKNVGVERLVRCALEVIEQAAAKPRPSRPCANRTPRQVLQPVARYRVDRDIRFRSVSDSALVLWRKERSELVGRPMLEVFPQIEREPKYHAHLDALAGGTAYAGVMPSAILRQPIDIRIRPDRLGVRVEFFLAA